MAMSTLRRELTMNSDSAHRSKTGGRRRLILLRHGESAWNAADRFAGWSMFH